MAVQCTHTVSDAVEVGADATARANDLVVAKAAGGVGVDEPASAAGLVVGGGGRVGLVGGAAVGAALVVCVGEGSWAAAGGCCTG